MWAEPSHATTGFVATIYARPAIVGGSDGNRCGLMGGAPMHISFIISGYIRPRIPAVGLRPRAARAVEHRQVAQREPEGVGAAAQPTKLVRTTKGDRAIEHRTS